MNKVEKIKKFPLKSVWKSEAHDFTPWLCENMDYLSEQLGFNIINASSEMSSDNFRVDIQTTDSFISGATGVGGISWTLWLNKDNMRLEVRIDKGKGYDEENIAIFRKLEKHRENIEKEFGSSLNWEEMTGYRLCSIRKDFDGGWAWPKDEWPKIIEIAAGHTRRLIKATKPYIAELK